MAEDVKETKPKGRAYDVAIPDAYSNNSEIVIGQSEIAIAFFQDIGFHGGEVSTQKSLLRVVMTHETFLNFVSYCNTRAKLIQDAYDGPIPVLGSKERTPDDISQSFVDMNARRRVVARFEFSDEEAD